METNKLSSAFKKIAFGYILICFNFNLGPIDILPDFAGYLLMLQAISILSEYTEQTSLLKTFGITLTLYEVLTWILPSVSEVFPEAMLIVELVIGAINIYFHFQLITDVMTVAKEKCPSYINRLSFFRVVYVSVCTIGAFVKLLPHAFVIILALAGVISALVVTITLYQMSKEVENPSEN